MADGVRSVSFRNRAIDLAGDLYLPEGFSADASYPAIVIATPGSSVKEQIAANYARKLVAEGFVVVAFDPSYQGESKGEPRDLEDPYVRVEDIRCALDFLMTQPFVDPERVGLLGICAGGGYAVNAALTEHRFKAVGTVVATNIGRAFREMLSMPDVMKLLDDVGDQRTAEARGGEERRDPWIPDCMEDAKAAGITDVDMLAAVEFYRDSSYRHSNSTNRIYFGSFGLLLGFDAFHLVSELLTQPLQVIVGGRRGITGSYEDGETLYKMAPGEKEFFVVEDAGHYDMYHIPEFVDQAVAKLASFYRKHLGKAL